MEWILVGGLVGGLQWSGSWWEVWSGVEWSWWEVWSGVEWFLVGGLKWVDPGGRSGVEWILV